jgi:type II secretory ATPase GspE/PulE/Tfp pilus assembly ATPase PilB-like protein
MTDAVTYELLRGADPARIREIARAEGMHTLTQHALQLVASQITTIDELRRTL